MPLVHRGPEPTLARALRDPSPQGWCCPSPLALLESLQELPALGLPPSLLGPCWPDTPTSSSLLPQDPVLSQKPPHTHTHTSSYLPPGGTWTLLSLRSLISCLRLTPPHSRVLSVPDPWAPAGVGSVCWQCGTRWALPVPRKRGLPGGGWAGTGDVTGGSWFPVTGGRGPRHLSSFQPFSAELRAVSAPGQPLPTGLPAWNLPA